MTTEPEAVAPSATTARQASPWRRRLVLCAALFVVCAGVAAVGVVHHFQTRIQRGKRPQMDALLAQLAADGEPTAHGDLVPPFAPGVTDGGPLVREALAWIDSHAPPRTEWPALWGEWDEQYEGASAKEREELAAFVDLLAPSVALLHEAAECDVVCSIENPDPYVKPASGWPIGGVQSAMRVMVARRLTAEAPAERLRALHLQAQLGARLAHVIDEMTGLVGMVGVSTSLQHLRAELESSRVPATDARHALAPALQYDVRATVLAGLRGHRVQTISIVRTMIGDERTASIYDGPIVDGWMGDLSRESLARYIEGVQDVLDLRHTRWTDLGRAVVELHESNAPPLWRRDVGSGVAGGATAVLPRFVSVGARVTAIQALARLSLAALAAHAETGEWPATLDAIDVPADVRVDPFTDAPFEFERLPDGIRLSSPGPLDPEIWGEGAVEKSAPLKDGLVWTLRR